MHYNAFNGKWVCQHILTITKISVTGVTLPKNGVYNCYYNCHISDITHFDQSRFG